MMDAFAKFWWGDDENNNKMHWYAWWKMCYPKNEGGMGFRNFQSFNLAMLAKQVWRLIDNPNSLCARVLGAKYYPNGDILRAGPKAGSSFTLQSILSSLTTFKRGFIWRVGDGDSINIWTDPWIPSSPSWKIQTRRGSILLTKVSQLIDPNGQWDEVLIRSLFTSLDANRILEIPLNTQGFSDFIAWGLTKHGFYSVRSAYRMQWRHKFGPHAGQLALPGSSIRNPVWKVLWKLLIPGKVKIFIWRALHGILPFKSILINRHIGTAGECPIFHQGPEDIMHLLFKCHTYKDLWQSLGLENTIDEATSVDRARSAVLEYLLRQNGNTLPGFDSIKLKETICVSA
jgi:hypothetical protein